MKLKRRLTPESFCKLIVLCPDIWETEAGDFMIIGTDITNQVDDLPADVVISKGERAVLLPRELLISAKPYIPSK